MELETEREVAVSTMLRQVLQNHVTSQALAYQETLGACVSVLGYVLYVLGDTPADTAGLVEQTIAALHAGLGQRLAQDYPPFVAFAEYAPWTTMSEPAQELGTALATYLATAGIEYRMTVVATWRAYLPLVVELLVLPLYAGIQTSAEVTAAIEALRDTLPVIVQMWGEEEE